MPFNFEDIDPEAYQQSVVKYSDDLMKQSVSSWKEGQTLLAFTAEGKPIRVTPGGTLSPLDREKLDMLQIGGDPTIYLDAYGEYKHVQFSELAGEPKDNSALWNELQTLIPRNIATSLMKDLSLEVPEEVRMDLVYHGVYTANGLPFEQRLALFSDDLSFSLIAPNQVRISVTNTPVAPGDGKITIHDVRHDTDQTFSVNQFDDQTITLDWSEVREKQNELRSGSESYPTGNLNPRIATINGMAILGEEAVEINFGNLPGDALDNASISALVDTLEEEIAEVVAHSDYRDITSLAWSDNELIAKRENGLMGPLVVTLPDVSLAMRGLATPALVAQVDQNTADIASLQGLGLVLADLGTDSPTQEELTAAWEEVKPNPPTDGARLVNLHNNHLWIYGATSTGTIWVDYGAYQYNIATTVDAGLVLASEDVESNYGKIAVSPEGVMRLIGYNSLMHFGDLVTDLETDDATRPAASSLTYELNDIKAARAFNPTAGRILVDDGAGNPSDGEYTLSQLQLKLSAAQITAINRAIFNLPAASHMLYILHQYSLLSVDESGGQPLNLIRFEHDASDAVVISGVNPFDEEAGNVRAYLWDAEDPKNEIATIGDLTYAAAPDEKYLTYDSAHKLTIKELSIDDSRVSETAAIKLKKILADATQVDKYLIVGQSGEIVYTYGGGGGGSASGFLSGVVLPPYEPTPLLDTDELWDPETTYTQDPLGLDYSDSDNWYVLPSKKKYEQDVFFFMPTWVINAEKAAKSPYLDSRDEELEEAAARFKAYVLTIFASDRLHFNVYFPRVRALNGAALGTDSGWDEMYDLLFEGPTGKDAMNAFDYYMRHENKGKQYILIGQEQGAFLAYFCLRYVVGEGADFEVQNLLIKAYLADFLMNSDYLDALPYPNSEDWDDSTPWANSPLSGKEFSSIADDEPYVLNPRSLLSYQKGMGAISTRGATGLAKNTVSPNGTKTFCPIDTDNVPLDKDTFFTQDWLDLCDTYNLSYWGVFSLSMFIGSLEALWAYYSPGRPSPMGPHYVNLSDIEQDDYLYKLDDGKSDKFYQDVDTISERRMLELHAGDTIKHIQLKEYNSDTYLGEFGYGYLITLNSDGNTYWLQYLSNGVPEAGLYLTSSESGRTLLQGRTTGRSVLADLSVDGGIVKYNAETRILTFTSSASLFQIVPDSGTGIADGPTADGPFYNFEVVTETNEKRWNLRDVFDFIGDSYYDKFAIDGALKDLMQAYNDYVRWGQYNSVGSTGEVYMSRPLSQTDTTPQLLRVLNVERFVVNCLNTDLTAIKFGEQLTATAYDVQNNYLKINSIRNSYSVEGDNGTDPLYKFLLLGSEASGDTEPGCAFTWPAPSGEANYGIEHTASKQNYYTAWFNGLINEEGLRYYWKDNSKSLFFETDSYLLQSNPDSRIMYKWYSDQEYFIMYNRFTEQNIRKDAWTVRFSNQEQTGSTFMQQAGYSGFNYYAYPNTDAGRPWWAWQMVGENAPSSQIPGLLLTWKYDRSGNYEPIGFFKADEQQLNYTNSSGELFKAQGGLTYLYPPQDVELKIDNTGYLHRFNSTEDVPAAQNIFRYSNEELELMGGEEGKEFKFYAGLEGFSYRTTGEDSQVQLDLTDSALGYVSRGQRLLIQESGIEFNFGSQEQYDIKATTAYFDYLGECLTMRLDQDGFGISIGCVNPSRFDVKPGDGVYFEGQKLAAEYDKAIDLGFSAVSNIITFIPNSPSAAPINVALTQGVGKTLYPGTMINMRGILGATAFLSIPGYEYNSSNYVSAGNLSAIKDYSYTVKERSETNFTNNLYEASTYGADGAAYVFQGSMIPPKYAQLNHTYNPGYTGNGWRVYASDAGALELTALPVMPPLPYDDAGNTAQMPVSNPIAFQNGAILLWSVQHIRYEDLSTFVEALALQCYDVFSKTWKPVTKTYRLSEVQQWCAAQCYAGDYYGSFNTGSTVDYAMTTIAFSSQQYNSEPYPDGRQLGQSTFIIGGALDKRRHLDEDGMEDTDYGVFPVTHEVSNPLWYRGTEKKYDYSVIAQATYIGRRADGKRHILLSGFINIANRTDSKDNLTGGTVLDLTLPENGNVSQFDGWDFNIKEITLESGTVSRVSQAILCPDGTVVFFHQKVSDHVHILHPDGKITVLENILPKYTRPELLYYRPCAALDAQTGTITVYAYPIGSTVYTNTHDTRQMLTPIINISCASWKSGWTGAMGTALPLFGYNFNNGQ